MLPTHIDPYSYAMLPIPFQVRLMNRFHPQMKLLDLQLRVNTGIPVVIKSLSDMQSCRSESGIIGRPSQAVATFIEWFIAAISEAQMGLSCWLRI